MILACINLPIIESSETTLNFNHYMVELIFLIQIYKKKNYKEKK
jgi:hypothetical protein